MRVIGLTGLLACLAVQGCAPPPGSYYGAPPGYAPQPYAAAPGAVIQQSLPPPQDPDLGYADPGGDPGYAQPGYVQPVYPAPAVVVPPPGYYGYGAPPPAYGYAPPPRFLPPIGFFGGRDRFERDRFERSRFERGRFERERFERDRFARDRGREGAERERVERSRMRGMERVAQPVPPPGGPLQGQARPQDFRRPPERPPGGGYRRGMTPDQLRQLR